MSYSNKVMVILTTQQNSKSFLIPFHKKLKELHVELSRGNYFLFNDNLNDEEGDPILISSSIDEDYLITQMIEWGSLGVIPYIHNIIELPFYIRYISWDAINIIAFEITISQSLENYSNKDKIITLIESLVDDIDFEFVVGSLGNSIDDFPIEEDSESIRNYIKDKVFDIDMRR